MIRVKEMWESMKIVEQCLDKLRPGPTMISDRKLAWPADLQVGPDGLGNSPKHIAKIMGSSMEALIHHFKLVTEGIRVPAGQVYVAVESPRGELGVHMVSDGGTRPYRVGHLATHRMQRRLRLRTGGDGQLGILRQPDAGPLISAAFVVNLGICRLIVGRIEVGVASSSEAEGREL